MRSRTRFIWAFVAALFVGACESSSSYADSGAPDAGGPTADAGTFVLDAGATAEERVPVSVWDDGTPDGGEFCYVIVGAQCDGPEDCADGQSCCGVVNGGSLAYESLGCRDTCDSAEGGYRLCHPDPAFVPTDGGTPAPGCVTPGHICRRSIILPAYMTICAAPLELAPTELIGASVAAGEVRCGSDAVCGAGQKCCMLGGWDATTRALVQRDGKCVDEDEACACEEASP